MSVGELLGENLRIPLYQRPYSWRPETAERLLDDITNSVRDHGSAGVPYVLGAVILHRGDDGFDVVDGQQRLLTLRMLVAQLDSTDHFSIATEKDNPVSRVWRTLRKRVGRFDVADSAALLTYVRERCQLVRIVTDDIDEAFRVFDSQNYRGKPLAPHDLLKAHHLREMRGETSAMKAAVVRQWESVRDEDLDRLFSVYLYRIARWSRGERAVDGFSPQDIGMFKGITSRGPLTPSARYHLAAQAAIPMLSAWGIGAANDDPAVGRSRFQLDAPLPAGRGFFEMVDFMQRELARLVEDAFPEKFRAFGLYDLDAVAELGVLEERGGMSRYRYVTELYLAALLYFTNRFGGEAGDRDFEIARDRLFAWAYAVRVELLRVQYRSVDNHARHASAAFTLLRNSTSSGRVLRELSGSTEPRNQTHEAKLVALLKELGA